MQITIGMKNVARELTFDVEGDIADNVANALSGESKLLDLTDTKGNRILISGENLAYVQIGSDEHRFVGFGA